MTAIMADIHPTAIIEDGARLGAGVSIGPFAMVGREVELEDGVTLDANVIVRGRTRIGARTRISPFAVIGGDPQDLSYQGQDTGVEIGADCVIREYATIHRGTARGRGTTTVGAHCFLMTGSHVAHDCVVGDHVILTNQATLGGHGEVGEYAILGGLSAAQQRSRIGAHCFIGGLTGVRSDIIPFAMAVGERAQLAGINVTGLKRRGFDNATIHALRAAYDLFFFATGSRAERIARVAETFPDVAAIGQLTDFLRASGNRPVALPRKRLGAVEID
jgi:UDP-N-acetylglucosamine acyltransferase